MSATMKYYVGEFDLPDGVSVDAFPLDWAFICMVAGKKHCKCYWPKGSVAQVRKMIIDNAPIDRITSDIFYFKLLGKYRK